jgi:hypothetical protein
VARPTGSRTATPAYLGYTDDLPARLAAHRAGRGSPLVAAAVRDGIDFELAATWSEDRREERRLHRYRNSPRQLCPICRAEPHPDLAVLAAPAGTRDASDQALIDELTELAEPVTLAALQAHLRRRGLTVGSAHGRLELLARSGRVRKGEMLGEIAWHTAAA